MISRKYYIIFSQQGGVFMAVISNINIKILFSQFFSNSAAQRVNKKTEKIYEECLKNF